MWWAYLLIAIASLLLFIFLIYVFAGSYFKITNVKCKSTKRLDGKTVIVTGSSAGIGYEVARDLARRGARVIVTCPFQEEGANAAKTIAENTKNQSVVFKFLDLSSLASVREFADDVRQHEPRLDMLINNAGVMGPDVTTKDGLNFIMQVNYFGHFLLTLLLLPLLKRTATPSEPNRIINTASMAHAKGEIDFKHWNSVDHYKALFSVYGNSKLCLTMFTMELSKRMNSLNVVVNTADPKVAATNIARNSQFRGKCYKFVLCTCGSFFPTPLSAAQTTLHLALDDNAGRATGEYFVNCKKGAASKKAYDEQLARKLWDESMRIVNLTKEETQSLIQ